MILDVAGDLHGKQTDLLRWRGTTDRFDGRALELMGVWQAYDKLYVDNPWVKAPVDKIANATARLPLKVYRRAPDSREDARDTPYGQLLAEPSQRVNSFAFWFWVRQILDIYGESFLGKVRDRGGRPIELVPLHPTSMQYDDNKNVWSYDDGKKRIENIPRRDLIHFRHVHPLSVRGLSPLESLRRTLALESGMYDGFSSPFANGARPGVLLEHPGKMTELGGERLKAQWRDLHSGAANWGKTVILEEGMKATVLPVNFEELQYIEARKLNQVECCAVYDISPTVVHILDNATYSNIVEQNRAFFRDTMAPRLSSIESTLEKELRDGSMGTNNPPDFDDRLYAEFLMDEVLRADFEARSLSYQQSDFMTIAEKRQKENLPFIPGTDRIFLNSASLPLGEDGQLEQPDSTTDKEMSPLELSNALQKIYLSVGSVISGDEAREILNRAGAGLTGSAPVPAPAASFQRSLSTDELSTVMGRLSRIKSLADIDAQVLTAGLNGHTDIVLDALAASATVDEFKACLKGL